MQAPNVPQPLQDYATVKNELMFTDVGQIIDINVSLDINHTYDADLNVFLVSPSGTRVKLFGDIGMLAIISIQPHSMTRPRPRSRAASAPFTGTFRPQESAECISMAKMPHGKWTLEITDDATGDIGRAE